MPPVWQSNHVRNVVDAVTGDVGVITTALQPLPPKEKGKKADENRFANEVKAEGKEVKAVQGLEYPSRVFISAPDMVLAYIPPGEFVMGSPPSDQYIVAEVLGEVFQHRVRISKGFYMGVTEVTQAQWKAIMRSNPSEFHGDNLPVENVSWYSAVKFCKKLSKQTGKSYRLPTEAEWEYACRAGTQTRFYFGDDPNLLGQYAWYFANSDGRTHPVAQKKPNAFGLYDMHGNVDEWCSDLFDDEYYKTSPATDPENTSRGILRVFRGGSWWGASWSSPLRCRSAMRGATHAHFKDSQWGFRVVMETE